MGADEVRARQVLLDMQELLSRDPYEALGLIPSATQADIRNAFLSKTKVFHPARFGRMSTEIQKLANEVFLALRAVHETLSRPSTVKQPAGQPRAQSGAIPALQQRPGGSGATPALRPGTQPQLAQSRSGALPLQGTPPAPPRAPTAPTPTVPRPAWPQTTPATRPGTMPTPIRPPTQPMRTAEPAPARPSPAPGGRGPAPAAGAARPGAAPVERELAPIYELFAQQQLAAARVALETLVARTPSSTRYQSLLSFAKGREAQLAGRIDEARVELHEALQLDPDLQLAKSALAELFTRRR